MRSRWYWLIPAVVIAGLLAPILFTDRTFATDWGNHLWLIWVQGGSIQSLGEPSYFLQSTFGAFYPYFAFYGGTFYAVLGVVSWWANPEAAALLAYGGALAASYLGWTWLARQAGVQGWPAYLPGCIAITAPYAVTNLYGRGDVPEAVATLVIPLAAASALSIVREPRVRLHAAAAYVLSVVVLTGTHTLTLVWGTTFLLLCAGLLIVCNWRAALERAWRGLTVAWLTLLGIGINAWILVPLFLLHTRLAEDEPDPIAYTEYTDPERLFSLFRNVSPDLFPVVRGDLNAQLSVLAGLWALICGVVFWRFLAGRSKRLAIGLLGLCGAFLLLILSPSLIEELPRTLRFIQFPYRLVTFADLCIVGLVTLALAAVQRAGSKSRIPIFLLAAIAAFNFGLAMDQNFKVRSWLPGREDALASRAIPPPSWYSPLQFADGSAPIVRPTMQPPLLVPVEDGDRSSYEMIYPPGPAGTVETNIVTGPYFVDLSGARPVGRTEEGQMVVRLPASPAQPRRVVAVAAWDGDVTVGRWLTGISLFIAFAGACFWALWQLRRGVAP